MNRDATLVGITCAILSLHAFLAHPSETRAEPTPACIKSRGETRARVFGYDHIVIIENGCDKPASCLVSTDVAPEPISTTVEAKKTVELTTFRGSPATVFKPRVDCKVGK